MRRLVNVLCTLIALALVCGRPLVAQVTTPRVMIWETSIAGSEDEPIDWPVGVAVDSAGRLIVADSHTPRAMRFSRGSDGWRLDRSVRLPAPPTAISGDGTRVVVALRGAPWLLWLEGDGMQLRNVPIPHGAVPLILASRRGGGFLVFDAAGSQVLRLRDDGALDGAVRVSGHVTALGDAPGGGFLSAVAENGVVRRHAPDGTVTETLEVPGADPRRSWPVGILSAGGGELFVLDRHGGRVVRLDAAGRLTGIGGRRGWDDGLLLYPAGFAALPGGTVAVADQGNGRIQLFGIPVEDGGS